MDHTTHSTEQDPSHHDAFPLGFPVTLKARKSLLEQLQKWREASNICSVMTLLLESKCDEPKQPVFFEKQVISSSPCRESCAHFAWPEQRLRPPIFDMNLAGCELTLTQRIKRPDPPDSYCAQLYEGLLATKNAKDMPTHVIAKVYQTSFSRQVKFVNLGDTPEELLETVLPFRREKWAYERMSHFEGTAIPHTAGFFQTTLPHGEPVVVLIMERVDSLLGNYVITKAGSPVLKIPDDVLQADVMRTLVYGLAATTHAMWSCGVVQLDMSGPNYLWPTFGVDFSSTCIPVAIDFVLTVSPEQLVKCTQFDALSAVLKRCTEYLSPGEKLADTLMNFLETDSNLKAALQIPDDLEDPEYHA